MAKKKQNAQADLPTQTAAERYAQLETEKAAYLQRAREVAKLTIPHLVPPEGSSGTTVLDIPYQGTGAECVNHLAAKLTLALFPPGGSFFRFDIDSYLLQQLAEKASEMGGDPEQAREEFDAALQRYEKAVLIRMEQKGVRARMNEATRQLITAGNVLLWFRPDGGVKYFKLDKYVVKRDGEGNVLEVIVKESVARQTLPAEVRDALPETPVEGKEKDADLDLYTYIYRSDDQWIMWQEVEGVGKVETTEGTAPLDKPVWVPLRWTVIDGEDYGRGHAEEFLGDLRSLEVLTKAIVRFSYAASKVLIFVDENGLTQAVDIEESESGDVVPGNAKDVTTLQLEKYHDFQVAKDVAKEIETRLQRRFLLFSSIQRAGERVTAEEIRTLAQELEQALGGIYSILAQELQYPLVVAVISIMQREGALPKLPDGSVQPQIIAGLEGLGRSSDLTKLELFWTTMKNVFGDSLNEYANVGAAGTSIATALGVDIKGLLKTDEDVADARAQAAQAQQAQAVAGPAMQLAGKAAEIQASQQAAEAQPEP